jgi:hypothetical protein
MVPKKLQSVRWCLEPEAAIKQSIVELRYKRRISELVNTWLRCINAYLRWLGEPVKISRSKKSKKSLATSNREVSSGVPAMGLNSVRTHTEALLMLGGYRTSEVLGLAA